MWNEPISPATGPPLNVRLAVVLKISALPPVLWVSRNVPRYPLPRSWSQVVSSSNLMLVCR